MMHHENLLTAPLWTCSATPPFHACIPLILKQNILATVEDEFDSTLVDQQLFESSKRTSVTNLHLVKIRELLIALPPVDEQEVICTYLDTKIGEIKRIVTGIESQIAVLIAYRKSLIHECVTGQRRVKEADVTRTRNNDIKFDVAQ